VKCLLLVPTHKYSIEYPSFLSLSDFPSAFGYLSASLKAANHEVVACNPNNIIGFVDAPTMLKAVLIKALQTHKPELVGMGGLCTDYKFFKDAITIVRSVDPTIKIVLGGNIVSNDAEDITAILQPDYAVCGDGEEVIVQIANGEHPVKSIIKAKPVDVDSLALPDYEPFGIKEMMDDYSGATRLLYRFSREYPRPYGIVTARNCPTTPSCSFCIDHGKKGKYQARTMLKIMEEIKIAYEKYKFNILIILDELFAVNKERMIEFCAGVMAGKKLYGWDFDWMFQTHASAKLDLATLTLAKQAGCVSFSYGLESASPTVLASMHKKINPDDVATAIQLAHTAKVGFSANLIFGDVAETHDTFVESACFWMKHARDAFVFMGTVIPYPGSELFATMQARGFFKDKKEYYEHIHQLQPNMTNMSDVEWAGHVQWIQQTEQAWNLVMVGRIESVEKLNETDAYLRATGGFYYRITAICPHCSAKITYREKLLDINRPFWLGTGCLSCNKRVKLIKG
jgi:radical SAM superfamily enzyme YgiQ (UPF0313 family)